MAKTIGSILVGVGLDTKQFQKDLKNLEYSLKRTATKFKGWGQDMSMAISVPIIAGAGAAIKAFADEENAIIKMNAAIKANGKNVDTLGTEYKSFAAEIQRMTVVEDDAVIAALQLAESMKLANPKEAVQGAIGLSRAFGIDLNTALKATAKGMNGQWTALQKLIPSIKLMGTDAEKAALFQDILNNSFKVAQEETTSTSGKLLQLKNNLGDLGEQFGEILAEYIKPFVDKIKELVFKFQELNPETKRMIVNIGLIAAAIGPALLIFGQLASAFSGIIGFARTLGSLIAGMAGPFTVLAGAIGFVAWNWDDFALKFKRDWELMKIDVLKLAQAFQLIKQGNFSAASAVWKAASEAQKEINDNYKTLFADKSGKKSILEQLKTEAEKLGKALKTNLVPPLKTVEEEIDKVKFKAEDFFKNLRTFLFLFNPIANKSVMPDLLESKGISPIASITQTPTIPIPGMGDLVDSRALKDAQEKANNFTGSINNGLTDLANNGLYVAAEGFANMFATIAAGGNLGDAFKGMLGGLMEVLEEFGRAAIKAGIAALGIESAIKGVPGGGFLAIAGGVALIALAKIAQAKIAKTPNIKGYASGGIFGDESLIRVGEYPGASSNPEVVAPLDKLKDMLRLNGNGMQLSVVIDSRLQGSDLRQSIQRTETKYSRL